MMNKKLTTIVLLLSLSGPFACAFGDQKSYMLERWEAEALPGVAPVDSDNYNRLCGSCHFPYQPGLLSALSWEKMMAKLPDHFSTSVVLPPADARELSNYLLNNAAGRANYEVSKQIMNASTTGEVPMKMTATAYFKARHKSVTAQATAAPSTDRNLADCAACHQHANEGRYHLP